MGHEEGTKVERAQADLRSALAFNDKTAGDEPTAFLAVAKAFEVAVEYGWKDLKRRLEEKGVDEAFAPKDVIRKAAQAGLIEDAQCWLDFIDARNDSVHDYYGMTQSEYVALAREFLEAAKKIHA